jgi:RNA polymerase sigma-70 factor (ECF subfamily)
MRRVTQDRIVRWFREWREPLRRFLLLRRSVSPSDIDDVAQEVFLRMLRYDRQELVVHPQAYLFKMASNVAAEWSIRAARRQPHASEWLAELAAESSPESDLQRDAEEAALLRALEALPPRAREVTRLHFSEGLTYQAIAERLRVTPRVVKREMVRAYAMLRGSLYSEGFESDQARRRRP